MKQRSPKAIRTKHTDTPERMDAPLPFVMNAFSFTARTSSNVSRHELAARLDDACRVAHWNGETIRSYLARRKIGSAGDGEMRGKDIDSTRLSARIHQFTFANSSIVSC